MRATQIAKERAPALPVLTGPWGPVSRAVHAARARFGRRHRLSLPGVVARAGRRAPTSSAPSPRRPALLVEPDRLGRGCSCQELVKSPEHPQPGTPSADKKLREACHRTSRSRARPDHGAASPCGRKALGLGSPHRTSRNRPGTAAQRRRSSVCANTMEHGHTHERSDLARAVPFQNHAPAIRLRAAKHRGLRPGWCPEGTGFTGRPTTRTACACSAEAGRAERRTPACRRPKPAAGLDTRSMSTDRPRSVSGRPRERTDLPRTTDATTRRNRCRLRDLAAAPPWEHPRWQGHADSSRPMAMP